MQIKKYEKTSFYRMNIIHLRLRFKKSKVLRSAMYSTICDMILRKCSLCIIIFIILCLLNLQARLAPQHLKIHEFFNPCMLWLQGRLLTFTSPRHKHKHVLWAPLYIGLPEIFKNHKCMEQAKLLVFVYSFSCNWVNRYSKSILLRIHIDNIFNFISL